MNNSDDNLTELVDENFSENRNLVRSKRKKSLDLTEEEKAALETSFKVIEQKIEDSKKLQEKREKSTLAFELLMINILSNYSSEYFPLSYEDLASYMSNPIDPYSLSISTKYSKQTLQKKFKRTIKKFQVAGVPVTQLKNGHVYMNNNTGRYFKGKTEFVSKLLDLINRSPFLKDELDRLITFKETVMHLQVKSSALDLVDVLYSGHYNHNEIDQKLLDKIIYAINNKENIAVNVFNKKGTKLISPYYIALCNGYYYIVGVDSKSRNKKLTLYQLDTFNSARIAYKSPFTEISNVQKIDELSCELLKKNNVDLIKEEKEICRKYILKETVGHFIEVTIKLVNKKLGILDIFRKFGPYVRFTYQDNDDIFTITSVPENIFIEWAIINSESILILNNPLLTRKINKKINSINKVKSVSPESETEIHIDLLGDDVDDVLNKINAFGLIEENNSKHKIIKCDKANTKRLLNFIYNHPQKVLLSQLNKKELGGSVESNNIYDKFIKNLIILSENYTHLMQNYKNKKK